MGRIIRASMISLAIVVFVNGCQYHSMIILDNPEFPAQLHPAKVNADLLRKYSIGNVIVKPLFMYTDGFQDRFKLIVTFYSMKDTPQVSIEALTVSVDGAKLDYGRQIATRIASDWRLGLTIKPFYSCHISDEPIDRPKEEMVEARVDVSVRVSVEDESGDITRETIDAYFLPKKRSFLE